jgi:hypothetical protein
LQKNQPVKPSRAVLEAELHAFKAERANSLSNVDLVIAWLDNHHRKPAVLSFTEGPERELAYRFEQFLRGEFICQKCGLRKNAETIPADF